MGHFLAKIINIPHSLAIKDLPAARENVHPSADNNNQLFDP